MDAIMLRKMLTDLESYKHTKSELLKIYISDRLNKSLETYQKELRQSLTYLTARNDQNVLRKMR